MFTLEQIRQAHRKVKSGADFPAYAREIKVLGVTSYETYVADGRTKYYGAHGYTITSPSKHDSRQIQETCNILQFKSALKAHQQGETDFPDFIKVCASLGVAKWEVRLSEMTCTYYDKQGATILVEEIPRGN